MKKLILIGLIIMVVLFSACNNPLTGCTKEAKICPDGSGVGRNPWKGCQFDDCPEVFTCESDSDCVIGKQVGGCCGCDWVYHKDQIDNKKIFLYDSEEYRALPMPRGCAGRECETCLGTRDFDPKCIEGECKLVKKQEIGLNECITDQDCIPKPSDCHATECINKVHEDLFNRPQMCTEMFSCSAAYTPEDCLCQDGECVNKNKDNQGCEE
ncbi:MAG: hypothetical protein KKE20_02850 [Nanoarchaeota archaeon]|nr:hypothetical protein [Nanoarchaeota archaeon]